MALRDQPYIPLYIQDIMTDEKLNECSAATHGIYIKGLMCLMHKSEEYGKILLKQKYKQNAKQSKNFACQLAKHLPYTVEEIEQAIDELVGEGVCQLEGGILSQKRMIKDNDISIKRAFAGSKGGKKSSNFAQAKTQAKEQANSEYEYEIENEYKNVKNKTKPKSLEEVQEYFKSKNSSILEAEKFYNYYEANGWTQGKGKKIKNWRAAASGWVTRSEEYKPKEKQENYGTHLIGQDFKKGW
jgi:HD superfamily phosphohydrolase